MRRDWNDARHYQRIFVSGLAAKPEAFSVEEHTYTLRKFRSDDGTTLWAAFHSSVKNPMLALIKGYRYHRKPVDPMTREHRKWQREMRKRDLDIPRYR